MNDAIISFYRRSSVSSFIKQQHHNRSDSTKSAGPRLDYRSMVSVEDMPELFVSFDSKFSHSASYSDTNFFFLLGFVLLNLSFFLGKLKSMIDFFFLLLSSMFASVKMSVYFDKCT